jgi:hypothetical protein
VFRLRREFITIVILRRLGTLLGSVIGLGFGSSLMRIRISLVGSFVGKAFPPGLRKGTTFPIPLKLILPLGLMDFPIERIASKFLSVSFISHKT